MKPANHAGSLSCQVIDGRLFWLGRSRAREDFVGRQDEASKSCRLPFHGDKVR
jgi:hypothetical protein